MGNDGRKLIDSVRKDYGGGVLDESMLSPSPFEQFESWLKDAIDAGIVEPNAMVLSTATREGIPSARAVLLKDYGETGFVFYSTSTSRKGHEIRTNPHAALTFMWPVLERQIRIEGTIHELPRSRAEAFFRARPRDAQLAAYSSPQSKVVQDRATLEALVDKNRNKFINQDIPLPEHWSAYAVIPHRIEFWQGRPSRLHDRLQYIKDDSGKSWTISRLAP